MGFIKIRVFKYTFIYLTDYQKLSTSFAFDCNLILYISNQSIFSCIKCVVVIVHREID